MTPPQDTPEREQRSPLPWVLATVVVGTLAVIAITQTLDGDTDQTAPTGTTPDTNPPRTTLTTSPPAAPTTTATTRPTTTAAPTTPTSTTATTAPTSGLPERAIGQVAADIVWVDPTSGATEVLFPDMFEASAAGNMSLSPDSSRLWYQLTYEDYWFSCESAIGEVTTLDLGSGNTRTVDRGLPALSPSGERLAYLTAEQCYPDPEQPDFFLTAYDTLVIADPEGNETIRFPLAADPEQRAGPLSHLVWLDDTTLLLSDGEGGHYRIPVDTDQATPILDHEMMELPDVLLAAVVGGKGLGARVDAATGPGPLLVVDLDTGEETPLDLDTGGFHAVGVSPDGHILVGTLQGGEPVLLVDVDLESGGAASVVDAPQFYGLDW